MNKCNLCNREFNNIYNFERHLKRKIPCNRVIQCNNCLTNFKTKQKLNNHLNRKNPCKSNILENTAINKLKQENNKLKETLINIGYIYILTNLSYEIQDIFKIGKTSNLKTRLSTYNTPKMEKDKYKYIYCFKTYDADNLEKYIHNHPKLKEYKTNNELYKIKLEDLKKIILEIKNEFDEYKI